MLAILAAVSLALAQQTDTTLPVRQGARLDVENFGGEIVVRTWAQDRVRIQATHSSRDWIEVSASPSAVRVEADRKSTRLNSSHQLISYAVFCLKKKKKIGKTIITRISAKNTNRGHPQNRR